MKILNLYACLGGNRYKWNEVNEDIEITAVELDPEAARLYQERFPNDTVIVADAHQYLLEHYKEFDFIWSSPPCPTHSRARYWNSSNYDTTTEPVYPDMNDRRFAISQAKQELKGLCEFHNYDFTKYEGEQSVIKMARNLVDYEAGKTILETALNIYRKTDVKQTSIFDYL
jgi:DNA (cytosine-5)-methyltransferase 1